jgi:hypothetical protein
VTPKCGSVAGDWHQGALTLHISQEGCQLTATGAAWNKDGSPVTGSMHGRNLSMSFGGKLLHGIYDPTAQPVVIRWTNGRTWTQGAAHPSTGAHLPTSQTFYIGNGGEYRKSYHGMPPGTAQVLHSPNLFHIQPMQIDTKNRDGSMESPTQGFRPGPYPRSAVAPRSGPDAVYSGLLECPCTDRITKKLAPTYGMQHSGSCATPVQTPTECWGAVAQLLGSHNATNHTGASADVPPGCTVTLRADGHAAAAFFNTLATADAPCGGATVAKLHGDTKSLVSLEVSVDAAEDLVTLTLTGPAAVWHGVGLDATAMSSLPYTIVVDGRGDVSERKLANHAGGTLLTPSVKRISSTVRDGQRVTVLQRPMRGASPSHYSFNATATARLDFINALGSTANYSYHQTKTAATLTLAAVDVPNCVCGHPQPFGQTKGSIIYTGPTTYIGSSNTTSQSLAFSKNCRPEPFADLLAQKNPTCDLKTYQGGLSCCHHLWLLTDHEQESSFDPQIFEYYLKFRFYYQTYHLKNATHPASHQNLVRLYHQTEDAASEYDIPLCDRSVTAPEDCVHQITAHWQVQEMLSPAHVQPIEQSLLGAVHTNDTGVKIAFAGGHCHAPACLSLELYNADTGALICRQVPILGTSLHPNASSTAGGDGSTGGAYDEKGYVSIPPCLWGAEEHGLAPAPLLSWGTNLTSVKRVNNTYAHFGEMASWQMRGYATR